MGGGPPKENLLIILPSPEDRSITDKIREKFPYIEVNYHQLGRANLSFEADSGLPKGCSVKFLSSSDSFALSFARFCTFREASRIKILLQEQEKESLF
jgi:hypothetical protein